MAQPTHTVDDNPPKWGTLKDTTLQQSLRMSICGGSGYKYQCWWCKMVWTGGPHYRVSDTFSPSTKFATFDIYYPYTDVARRNVAQYMDRNKETHLACHECGEAMIALDKKEHGNA